jgi:1-acyl-sn-glycerol-3-phosphate acyltransferase
MTYSTPRAILRAASFLTMTIALLPLYLLAYPFSRDLRGSIIRLWATCSCALCGLDVRTDGEAADRRPTLMVSNHVSYLDVPVLAACLDASFIAKREVRGWPLFGFLARIGRTIFVERAARAIPGQVEALNARMNEGERLILFPEGTSSDGAKVLPFKTGLFRAAYPGFGHLQPLVQPVSVSYVDENGRDYAWHGDMVLAPHLWRVFQAEGTMVQVRFHEPVHPAAFPSRKALARHCEKVVARGMKIVEAPEEMPAAEPVAAAV